MITRRLLLCILLCLGALSVQAQTQAPPESIAILADVSISVRGDWVKHEEARELIINLITGHPIDWASSDWDVEATSDPDLLSLFGQALGRPNYPVPPEPLTEPGRDLLVLRVGKLSTVNESDVRRQIGQMSNLPEMVRLEYPKRSYIKDGSTCFWYAMERAAELLKTRSSDGYYLFVVSDEVDDPDYLPYGPPDHSNSDYQNYLKLYAAQYPRSTIEREIETHFEKTGRIGRDDYRTRPDFPMTLIAHFYQRHFPQNDDKKVRLSWYAMGVKPVNTPVRPAPPKEAEVVPPKFRHAIELLGGLENPGTKVFNYSNPLIVWQLPFGDANGLSSSRFEIEDSRGARLQTLRSLSASASFSPRLNGPKTAQLGLGAGRYTIQVVEKSDDGSEPIHSRSAIIEVEPWNDWILPALAAVSAICALVIFFWTWRSFTPKSVHTS